MFLARQLREHGYRCELVAPTKNPRKPGDRIKTDRRDALSLGALRPRWRPDAGHGSE